MNQSNSAHELEMATTRMLRWRIPLFVALIINIAVLTRLAFAPAGAVAALPVPQPKSVVQSVVQPGGALPTADTPAVGLPVPSASAAPTTASADAAAPAEPTPQTDLSAMHRSDSSAPLSADFATAVVEPRAFTATSDGSTTAAHPAPLPMTDYMPDWTDLADRWWPVLEATAQAALQAAASQPSQAGELTIGNVSQNGAPVSFLVEGRVYTLHPGESHQFPLGTSWNIQFHRGGAFGNTSAELTPGKYQFVVGTTGWALQPVR